MVVEDFEFQKIVLNAGDDGRVLNEQNQNLVDPHRLAPPESSLRELTTSSLTPSLAAQTELSPHGGS